MARSQMQQSLCQSPAMFDTMFCTKRSSALLQSQSVPACFSVSLPSTLNYNSRHIRIIAVYRGDCNARVPSGSNAFTLSCGCSVSGQFFPRQPRHLPSRSRSFTPRRAVDDTASQVSEPTKESKTGAEKGKPEGENGAAGVESFPTGDVEFRKFGVWQSFVVKLKMLIALPWQRVKKGSIFKLKISGEITEQLQGAFSQGMSLPQICQNIVKAAHDPRISGMIIQIEPLACGWPKIDEICRQIDYYKKSGKFLVAYLPVGGEKEYYLACACGDVYAPPGAYISLLGLKVQASFFGGVLEKAGVEPQIQRFGKYKSAGDLISRKDMSEANREMLTAILDDVYHSWLRRIASLRGKTTVDVENLLAEGIFETEKLKETGWITDIKYEDEIEEMLKKKLGMKEDKRPKYVDYKKYSRVKEWTLGLSGGKADIAVLRAVGNISRVQSGLATGGIASDTFVEEIRQIYNSVKLFTEAEHFKAVVLRIDSPGGDALASDLMWRELRLLAAKKPVIASMVDVAASGGYYMAMAAGTIVAESLTLTGSIGVVTGKFNLGKLYERIGFTKEIISRGKFAELDAEQRPFRPDEADYFARSAKNAYVRFRDKAAFSRSMQINKMEDVAQGRVWTGEAAVTHGLVDTIGGFSKAVAIAKQKAGIPAETKVKLVELSRRKRNISALLRSGLRVLMLLPSFFEILSSVKDKGLISEIQASMETINIEGEGLDTFSGSYGMDRDVAEVLDQLLNKP